jgi:light-regulated signal transduction histidine kinase (bacteriophytochrome)
VSAPARWNTAPTLRRQIVAQVTDREDIVLALAADHDGFVRLMNAHGGAISMERKTQVFGKAPSREGVNALINWLNENEPGDIFPPARWAPMRPR